ncbi:MAG: sialidase family protein [Candidatus Thermoplasmatota archaeon]|jgi:hypothetical protein
MRRSACVVLVSLAMLLASGCAQPTADPVSPPAAELEAAAPGLAFLPARSVATVPNSQHEAFVEVSPDGQVVLTCAHGFFKEPSHFFASEDGGATFRDLDFGEPMPPGGDCEVALAPTGAWAFSQKTDVGVTVVVTADGGESWTINHLAAPPVNGGADRQWLAYAGETLLLCYQPGSQQFGTLEVTRSADGGKTWSLPVHAVAPDPTRPRMDAGHFLVGPDGTLRIPVTSSLEITGLAGGSQLSFAVSQDGGASWSEEPVASIAGSPPNPSGAAQAADGSLTWAYADGSSDALLVIGSQDGGATWTVPLLLDEGLDWPRPWASARPDGTVDIVWLSTGAKFGAQGPQLALARVDLRVEPAVVSSVVIDDLASIEYAAVAHDAAGRATVVAADAPATSSNPLGPAQILVIQEAIAADAPAPTA